MHLSREFRLLLACCRSAWQRPDSPLLGGEPAHGIDWPLLVRLARFHRVEGLAWRALEPFTSAFPERAANELSQGARAIAAASLRSAAESGQLLTAFRGAGVDLLFVKGLTLGVLAYGSPQIKSAVDIDLLVRPEQLGRAAEILAMRGFAPILPSSAGRLGKWHRTHKESLWVNHSAGLQVDLHSRLSDNPALIAAIGMDSPRQPVEVAPGIVLPTLARDELFAYLCVHGASSAWFRLKWITDLAGLLDGAGRGSTERLYRRSQELGAERSAGQALVLADRLFGILGDLPGLKAELCADRSTRMLASIALRQLAGREEPAEPTERTLGTAAIHYSQLLVGRGLGFKLGEALRQIRSVLGRAA